MNYFYIFVFATFCNAQVTSYKQNFGKSTQNSEKRINYPALINYTLITSELVLILRQIKLRSDSQDTYTTYLNSKSAEGSSRLYNQYLDIQNSKRTNALLLGANSLALLYLHYFTDYSDLFTIQLKTPERNTTELSFIIKF